MNIFLLILFIILLAIAPYAIIRYKVIPLETSDTKKEWFVITIIAGIVIEVAIIALAVLPNRINNFTIACIQNIESRIEASSPGYTGKELDKEEVKTFLNNSREITSSIRNDNKAGFLTNALGVGSYISFFDSFCNDIDNNIKEFENTNTPFTLHNIFMTVQEKTEEKVFSTMKILQILIIAAGALFYLFAAIFIKNRKSSGKIKSVTFGDDA